MIKEQDCFICFPGEVKIISISILDNYLSRTEEDDNQRMTEFYYIYAMDNLLGGK